MKARRCTYNSAGSLDTKSRASHEKFSYLCRTGEGCIETKTIIEHTQCNNVKR